MEPVNHRRDARGGRPRPPSGLARDLSWRDGDKRALSRSHRVDELEHVRTRVAFDIQLDAGRRVSQQAGDRVHVLERNVPAIGARMHRDAERTRCDARGDCFNHARDVSAPGIAERRHFVHVH